MLRHKLGHTLGHLGQLEQYVIWSDLQVWRNLNMIWDMISWFWVETQFGTQFGTPGTFGTFTDFFEFSSFDAIQTSIETSLAVFELRHNFGQTLGQ